MTYSDRFAPTPYRSGFALEILTSLATVMDEVRKFVSRMASYLTPSGMPADFLPWMAASLGLPDDLDLPEDRTRAAISIAVQTWVNKGPAPAIQTYVRALTGITSVVESTAPVVFKCGTSYPLTVGVSGSTDSLVGVTAVGIDGWNFTVTVPTNSILEDELRRLLKPVVPVFCSYTVIFN